MVALKKAALFLLLTMALSLWEEASAQDDSGEARFFEMLERIEQKRQEFANRYRKAETETERKRVLSEARAFVVNEITHEIAPAWLGEPWTMAVIKDGLKPNARWPGEPGSGISCSWFVVRTLQNAGLKFSSPRQFAGAIAARIQYSTVPDRKHVKRFFKTSPKELEQRMLNLGDGLYVVGLNCHIGFIHVNAGVVNFIHSSYVEPYKVVIERLADSQAIALSEKAGYVVSPLFHDGYLLDYWLSGRGLPFKENR